MGGGLRSRFPSLAWHAFLRAGREVASISKSRWAWTDSYGVEIIDGEDEISILCTCIVIDQVLHDGDDD